MRGNKNHQNSLADVMTRISVLPASKRVDALLDAFGDMLNAMDPRRVRKLRDEIMVHFSTCGCSFETSELMIDLINAHLALRERGPRRHATRRR
jgi:hypothetical protein